MSVDFFILFIWSIFNSKPDVLSALWLPSIVANIFLDTFFSLQRNIDESFERRQITICRVIYVVVKQNSATSPTSTTAFLRECSFRADRINWLFITKEGEGRRMIFEKQTTSGVSRILFWRCRIQFSYTSFILVLCLICHVCKMISE